MEGRNREGRLLSFVGMFCCWFLAIATSLFGWLPDFLEMPYSIFALAIGLASLVLAGLFPMQSDDDRVTDRRTCGECRERCAGRDANKCRR